MSHLVKAELAESLARLHAALDKEELTEECGRVIEQFVGPVSWHVLLGDPQDGRPRFSFGGVGSTIGVDSPEGESQWTGGHSIELSFRDEVVGSLELGIDVPPDDSVRSALGAHLGAAVVSLHLWTHAEEECRQRRLGQEMLGDISTLLGSFDIEYVLARSLDLALRVVGSDVGSVTLWDGKRFTDSVSLGLPDQVTREIQLDGRPVAELVVEEASPVVLNDPDVEHLKDGLDRIQLSVLLLIPLVSGGRVERSILSPNVRVHSYANVFESILMEGVNIGRGAQIRKAIIDKGVCVPEGCEVGYDLAEDAKKFMITDSGIVVVPKGTPIEQLQPATTR